MKYKIRRATSLDEKQIMDFRKKLFAKEHKSLNVKYWRWKFRNNPLSNEVPFYIIEYQGRVVGTQGFLPYKYKIGKDEFNVSQLVDFNVDENFRGLPAVKLFRAVCKNSIINMGANISLDAKKFFKKAKWIDFSSTISTPTVTNLIGCRFTGEITFIKSYTKYFLTAMCLKRISLMAGPKTIFVLGMPKTEDLQTLLYSITESMVNGFVKDLSYFKWRYIDYPLQLYDFACVYENEKLKAISVFRISEIDSLKKELTIVDLLYFENDRKIGIFLISKLVEMSIKLKCNLINTQTTISNYRKIFSKVCFKNYQSDLGLMVHSTDKSIYSKILQINEMPFIIGDTDLI